MAIENANGINELNPLYPLVDDELNEGDDQLRQIKKVVKNSLPNINGAVNIRGSDLNKCELNKDNYNEVLNPRDNDLIKPTTVNQAIDYNLSNTEAKLTGSTFKDGTYDENASKPENTLDNYPIDNNIHSLKKRLDSISASNNLPIGTVKIFHDDKTPEEAGLSGTWRLISEASFLVGVGTGVDTNGIERTFNSGYNNGENKVKLQEKHVPEHEHTSSLFLPAAFEPYYRSSYEDLPSGGIRGVYSVGNYTCGVVGTIDKDSHLEHENRPPYKAVKIYEKITK